MDEIKTIREALEWVNARYDETEIIKRALAALSRLAEPGEDARELACAVYCAIDADIDAADAGKPLRELEYVSRAAALIERYVAAQVAKAREEVDAMLWTTERVMGADAADAMRRWLDDYRATGRLVVRDAGGAEIEHFPEARA